MQHVAELLRDRVRNRATLAMKSYREMVTIAASGGEIDPNECEAVLEAANRTIDDFLTDEQKLSERNSMRERAKQLPHLQTELTEVEQKQRELGERLRKFQDQCRVEDLQLIERRNCLVAQICGLEETQRRLSVETVDDGLADKQRHLSRQAEALVKEMRGLEYDLNRMRDGTLDNENEQSKQSRLDAAKARLAELHQQQAEVTSEFVAN